MRLLILCLLFIGLSASSEKNQLLPTKLRITVVDDLGNIQEGAVVTVYHNDADYRAEKNAVASETTDSKGKATFKKLESKKYFIHVVKGDLNNDGGGVQVDTLEPGKMNKINVVIR